MRHKFYKFLASRSRLNSWKGNKHSQDQTLLYKSFLYDVQKFKYFFYSLSLFTYSKTIHQGIKSFIYPSNYYNSILTLIFVSCYMIGWSNEQKVSNAKEFNNDDVSDWEQYVRVLYDSLLCWSITCLNLKI